MEFKTNAAPYVRSKRSTLQIMIALCIALAIVWVFGIIYSFKLDSTINPLAQQQLLQYTVKVMENGKEVEQTKYYGTTNYGLMSILNVLIAVIVSAGCDAIINLVKQLKKNKTVDGKELLKYVVHNYSYVSGLIFALTVPAYTNVYIIIIGSIFATIVCKNVFGGFGKNVFNPAAMARIFVALCFGAALGTPDVVKCAATYLAGAEEATTFAVDAVSGATLTTVYNNVSGWMETTTASGNTLLLNNVLFNGFTTVDLLTGNYLGALGETFTIVIFVLGIVLSVLKVINWRTPVFYLGTVALSALLIALFNGLNPGLYVLAHLSLGGLMFGAVFMLTDPVTGPTSNYGKCIAAIFAGFLTVLIRVKGGYPEGVVYSIAMANLLTPLIDTLLKGKTNSQYTGKIVGLSAGVLCSALILGLLGSAFYPNKGLKINYNENATLNSYYKLEEGQYYETIEGFTPKTAKCTEFLYDIEKEDDVLKASYVIKDKSNNIVAYCYTVKDTFTIEKIAIVDGTPENWGPSNITCGAFVVIGADGKLLSFTTLSPNGCSTGGTYKDASNAMIKKYIGLKKSEFNTSNYDVINGLSYSPKFIRLLINDAYAEFEQR